MNIELSKHEQELMTIVVKNFFETEGKKHVDQYVDRLKPVVINVPEKDLSVSYANGTKHEQYKKFIFNASVHKRAFLAGPTGSGKTHMAHDLAKDLDKPFGFISCSEGMSEGHLLGRMLADGTFVNTEFLDIVENGGVFLADEADGMDANVGLIFHSLLANGVVSVPNRKDNPVAKVHKDFIMVMAANSWGNGSFEYAGRGTLDKALLNRFAHVKQWVDYDERLEINLVPAEYKTWASELQAARKFMKSKHIDRDMATRNILMLVKSLACGLSKKEIIEDYMLDWNEDEVKAFKEWERFNGIFNEETKPVVSNGIDAVEPTGETIVDVSELIQDVINSKPVNEEQIQMISAEDVNTPASSGILNERPFNETVSNFWHIDGQFALRLLQWDNHSDNFFAHDYAWTERKKADAKLVRHSELGFLIGKKFKVRRNKRVPVRLRGKEAEITRIDDRGKVEVTFPHDNNTMRVMQACNFFKLGSTIEKHLSNGTTN